MLGRVVEGWISWLPVVIWVLVVRRWLLLRFCVVYVFMPWWSSVVGCVAYVC